MKRLAFLAFILLTVIRLSAAPVPLFDGKTFTGWEGDTADIWRIEDGGLAAGSLERRLAKSEFLPILNAAEANIARALEAGNRRQETDLVGCLRR